MVQDPYRTSGIILRNDRNGIGINLDPSVSTASQRVIGLILDPSDRVTLVVDQLDPMMILVILVGLAGDDGLSVLIWVLTVPLDVVLIDVNNLLPSSNSSSSRHLRKCSRHVRISAWISVMVTTTPFQHRTYGAFAWN